VIWSPSSHVVINCVCRGEEMNGTKQFRGIDFMNYNSKGSGSLSRYLIIVELPTLVSKSEYLYKQFAKNQMGQIMMPIKRNSS